MEIRNNEGYLNSETDFPALVIPGKVAKWYKNGILHREDGPAIIKFSGDFSLEKMKSFSSEDVKYYLNGKEVSEDAHFSFFWFGGSRTKKE